MPTDETRRTRRRPVPAASQTGDVRGVSLTWGVLQPEFWKLSLAATENRMRARGWFRSLVTRQLRAGRQPSPADLAAALAGPSRPIVEQVTKTRTATREEPLHEIDMAAIEAYAARVRAGTPRRPGRPKGSGLSSTGKWLDIVRDYEVARENARRRLAGNVQPRGLPAVKRSIAAKHGVSVRQLERIIAGVTVESFQE